MRGKNTFLAKLSLISLVLLVSLSYFAIAAYATVEDDFLVILNDQRQAHGLSPLTLNPMLTEAGRLHSQDMLDQNYFSHTSLDGRTFVQRIVAQGYTPYSTIGENIAYHSGSPDAAFVFQMWNNSPGHYANMMSPNFREMGLGIATGNGLTYYTQDLGTRPIACISGQEESRTCGVSNIGACSYGNQTRICQANNQWGSYSSCTGNIDPVAEHCGDGIDNDCDGQIDEDCTCTTGVSRNCGITDRGECRYGTQDCAASVWQDCTGNIDPVSEICSDLKDNDCDGSIDEGCSIVSILEPSFTVNSTSLTSIYFTFSTSGPAKLSADFNNKTYLFCTSCSRVNLRVYLSPGENLLTLKAETSGGLTTKDITIISDPKPIIHSAKPDSNGYTNGIFTVNYTETNLVKAEIYYRYLDEQNYTKTIIDCQNGTKINCTADIILPKEGTIYYYFNISDPASNTISPLKRVFVILSQFQVNITSPADSALYPLRVPLTVNANRRAKMMYIIYNDSGRCTTCRRLYTLCTSCSSVNTATSLSSGDYTIAFAIQDLALGEIIRQNVSFSVDSIKPVILETRPKLNDAFNNQFMVRYNETNLNNATLFYKLKNQTLYANITKTDCVSGQNQTCLFDINPVSNTTISYYFILSDVNGATRSFATAINVP